MSRSWERDLAIANDFEQVAVGIEKISAVVIAPIDRRRNLHAGRGQAILRRREILVTDAKCMMSLTQWMSDALLSRGRIQLRTRYAKQREILITALHQNLIAEPRHDRDSP